MKFVCGIQARSTSTRLPGKTLMIIDGSPVWMFSYTTCKSVFKNVVMLVPENDLKQIESCEEHRVKYLTGDELNPLNRYVNLAFHNLDSDYVVRCTSDCAVLDRFVLQAMVKIAKSTYEFDLITNSPGCCDGHDVEIIKTSALLKLQSETDEHVTSLIRKDPRKCLIVQPKLSIDTLEDFELCKEIIEKERE